MIFPQNKYNNITRLDQQLQVNIRCTVNRIWYFVIVIQLMMCTGQSPFLWILIVKLLRYCKNDTASGYNKTNNIMPIKFLKHPLPKIKGKKENCKWKEINSVDNADKRNRKYESMKITPGHSITHSTGWRFCQAIISPDRPTIVVSPHWTYVTGSHIVVLLKWLSTKAWQTLLRIICMVVVS